MTKAWSRPVVAALAAATVIFGLLLVLPGSLMDGYDLARMHQCYKADFRAAVLGGEWPWWNPYTALGRPFFADIETTCLYPPNWLVLPFGVTGGIFLMIWLHLALAVEGGRRLGEQLGLARVFAFAAGGSFALSGALLGRLQAGQLQVFCVLCLVPWVWYTALKLQVKPGARNAAGAALALAGAILAGSPQLLWCGLVPLGVLLLARSDSVPGAGRFALWLLAAGLLAAGLDTVQLLPFAELVQQGNRPLHDATFATRGGEAGISWLTLVIPPGSWLRTNGEFNLYAGAPFLLLAGAALAAAARERTGRALALAGLFGFVLALGDGSFVLPRLAEWVPGFAGVRFPSRYGLAGVLAVNLLAAWWLDRETRERRIGPRAIAAILTAQALALGAGLFLQAAAYAVPATPTNEAQLRADLRDEGLPRDGAPPRVALPASVFRADAGAQSDVSTLTGFNNPGLARTWGSLYLLANETPPDFHRAEVKDEIITAMAAHGRFLNLSAALTMPGHVVHFGPPAVPRAFLSFAAELVPDWRDAVQRVRNGHDFATTALVEQPVELGSRNVAKTGTARITAFHRNTLVVDCDASAPALLVLAEAWYPGWTAQINGGAPVPVMPANGWMRAVVVPAGVSRVEIAYRPVHWWTGFGITVLSAALAGWLWCRPPAGKSA